MIYTENINTAAAAVMMLILNMTSGQLIAGLTPIQKDVLKSPYVKWITILAISFVGTRNIWMSAGLTIIIILLLEVFLNEHSRYYIFSRYRKDGKHRLIGTGALKTWGRL